MHMPGTTRVTEVAADVPLEQPKDKVIFCDFQKVLCFEELWFDVRADVHDPEHELLDAVMAEGNRMGFEDWMRSKKFDTDDVIESGIVRHTRESWELRMSAEETALVLRDKLERGMAKVPLDQEMVSWLASVRGEGGFYTVLATDNMSVATDGIRKHPDILRAFDDVLSSCDENIRCLKHDDPVAFFGPWLVSHNLDFDNAVLIDDNLSNIEEFEAAGGTGLLWTPDSSSEDAQAFVNEAFGLVEEEPEEGPAEEKERHEPEIIGASGAPGPFFGESTKRTEPVANEYVPPEQSFYFENAEQPAQFDIPEEIGIFERIKRFFMGR